MNPNGALVPTVAAVSRAPASVRWNQQQLVRWQRTLLLLLRRCRRSPDTRRRSGGRRQEGKHCLGRHGFYQPINQPINGFYHQAYFLHLSVHIFLLLPQHFKTVAVANSTPKTLGCGSAAWSDGQCTVQCPSEGISNDFFKAHEDIVEP